MVEIMVVVMKMMAVVVLVSLLTDNRVIEQVILISFHYYIADARTAEHITGRWVTNKKAGDRVHYRMLIIMAALMKDFRLVLYNVSLPWHLPHLVTHPDLMYRKAGLTMGQTFMIIFISSYMEKRGRRGGRS
jgi:hypothetical protein